MQLDISPIELDWYKRLGIDYPTDPAHERHRRRAAFRNERVLHRRRCDATGRNVISVHSEQCPGPVYNHDAWWGDTWSASSYGRDFDFNRPFFEQFLELLHEVPKIASAVTNSENCEFNVYCTGCKNCYMSQRVGDSEDIYYSYLAIRSKDCADSYNITDCELCYEVVDGTNCYNVQYSQNVSNCSNSSFLFNCRGCKDCFFCFNLRDASYCFMGEQLKKEDYQEKIARYSSMSWDKYIQLWNEFLTSRSKQIVPAYWGSLCENVSGNYIQQGKDVTASFDVLEAESIAHCRGFIIGKNCVDTDYNYRGEECFHTLSVISSNFITYCFSIYNNCHDIDYSMYCMNGSHHLFGCIGMKHAEYCIFNKQYKAEQWRSLRAKIIEHMKKTGEWSKFFPASHSLFAYNETVAHEYYPLERQSAESQGYRWWEETEMQEKLPKMAPPNSIEQTDDSILDATLSCEQSGKDFKLQQGELLLYRRLRIPVPRYCPNVRYQNRVALRNPRRLYERKCASTGKTILTTYAPECTETVLDYDKYVARMR